MESFFSLNGDNYVSSVVLLLSFVGFVQSYIEMTSILLIHDANFLEYITLQPEYFSFFFILWYSIGQVIGSLLSCSLSDRVGRRPTLLIFSAFFIGILSWMTSSDSDSVVQIGRFFIGVTIGVMNCVALVYIVEISPPDSRGQICGLFPLFQLIGTIVSMISSRSVANQQDGWRILIALPVLPSLIVLLTLVFIPDSPLWLIANKTPMDGFAALERYRRVNEATIEFNSVYRALAYDARHDHTWRSLLSTDRSMKYRLGLMTTIQLIRVFLGERLLSSSGLILLHPIDPHTHPSELILLSIILFFFSAASGLLIGCINIDSNGRRPILLIGIVSMILFTIFAYSINSWGQLESHPLFSRLLPFSFAVYFMKYLYGGFLCFFVFSYYFSFGSTSGILPMEIFPLRARARSVSLIQSIYTLGVLGHYLLENWLNQQSIHLSTSNLLLGFLILLIFIGVYLFFALPETHGIVFEDSDELFDIEEYDSCLICIPRGTGTGFLGFRTLSQSGARFQFYQLKKPSFNEGGSSTSTPNSSSKTLFPPRSGSVAGSGGGQSTTGGGENAIIYDHKYSETMRHLNFQYVTEEEEPLHTAPLFSSDRNDQFSSLFLRSKTSSLVQPTSTSTSTSAEEKFPSTPSHGYSYPPISFLPHRFNRKHNNNQQSNNPTIKDHQ